MSRAAVAAFSQMNGQPSSSGVIYPSLRPVEAEASSKSIYPSEDSESEHSNTMNTTEPIDNAERPEQPTSKPVQNNKSLTSSGKTPKPQKNRKSSKSPKAIEEQKPSKAIEEQKTPKAIEEQSYEERKGHLAEEQAKPSKSTKAIGAGSSTPKVINKELARNEQPTEKSPKSPGSGAAASDNGTLPSPIAHKDDMYYRQTTQQEIDHVLEALEPYQVLHLKWFEANPDVINRAFRFGMKVLHSDKTRHPLARDAIQSMCLFVAWHLG